MPPRIFWWSYCLCVCIGFATSHALTLDEIIVELRSQPIVDTFEVKMATTITVQDRVLTMNSHIISKGPEKVWMEQQSSLGTQRIIRNGDKAQSIDLGTGRKQTLSAADVAGLVGSRPQPSSLFDRGRFFPPRNIGGSRYQVDMIPGTDSSAASRSIVYDAVNKSIVKITQIGLRQDTTLTELTQGNQDGRNVLNNLKMEIRVGGFATQMRMDYSDYAFPKSILDGLFTIRE